MRFYDNIQCHWHEQDFTYINTSNHAVDEAPISNNKDQS